MSTAYHYYFYILASNYHRKKKLKKKKTFYIKYTSFVNELNLRLFYINFLTHILDFGSRLKNVYVPKNHIYNTFIKFLVNEKIICGSNVIKLKNNQLFHTT